MYYVPICIYIIHTYITDVQILEHIMSNMKSLNPEHHVLYI